MNARISPTSPKARTKPEADVSALYAGPQSRMDRPHRGPRWFLIVLVAFVVGAAAGIAGWAGVSVLHARYPEHPLWSRLGLLSIFEGETVTVRYVEQSGEDERRVYDALRKALEMSVVELYPAVDGTKERLESAIPPGDLRGFGVLLSNDGILAAEQESLAALDGHYRLLTSDEKSIAVGQVVGDPASNLRFAAMQSAVPDTLRPARLARSTDLFLGETVAVFRPRFAFGGSDLLLTTIADIRLDPVAERYPAVLSSERAQPFVRLAANGSLPDGAIVATMDGDLIGFVDQRDGIARSMPLESVTRILPDVKKDTIIDRPYLGVSYVDLSTVVFSGESQKEGTGTGALLVSDERSGILAIKKRSPAAEAGLREGDIVTAIDGEKLSRTVTLSTLILAKDVGAKVAVLYVRDGRELTAQVTLARVPE